MTFRREQAVEGLDAEPARSLYPTAGVSGGVGRVGTGKSFESLQACCQGILGLDPTLTALLAAEPQWIDSVSSKEMLPHRHSLPCKCVSG